MNMNNNVTTGRQYRISTIVGHNEHGHVLYKLGFYRTNKPTDEEANDEAEIYVDKYDFLCIAKAVMRLVPETICSSKKVLKKYFEDVHYNPGISEDTEWEFCNIYNVKAERTVNPLVVGANGTNIYKLTLTYMTPFHSRDEFVFHLREADFIALGKLCCVALDEDTFRGWWTE